MTATVPTGLGPSPGASALDDIYRDRFQTATLLFAQVAVVASAVDYRGPMQATAGLIIALALAPLWVTELRKFSLAPVVGVLVVASLVAGYWLGQMASIDHEVSSRLRLESFVLLLSGASTLVLLLWARTLVPLHRVVMLYGVGALGSAVIQGQFSWKFDLAVPVTFLVLGFLEQFRSRAIPAVAVLVLGVAGIIDEGRSFFGFCVLAATLTLLQIRPKSSDPDADPMPRWFPAAVLGGVAVSMYFVVSALLTGGHLGSTLQERSVAQIDSAGSLLAGGRPEWAATRELVKMRPEGFGAGVVPSWTDLEAGKSGLASINIDAGGYTNNYMFGGQFRLHSVLSDLWVSYGWIGAALGIVILVGLIRSLSFLVAGRVAATSAIFAASLALWYMLFGPIYSNWDDVCAALGIVLFMKAVVDPPAADPPDLRPATVP